MNLVKNRRGGLTLICLLFLLLIGIGCSREEEVPAVKKENSSSQVKEAEAIPTADAEEDTEELLPVEEETQNEENIAPQIVSLKLTPQVLYPGTKVKVVVEAEDREGEPVSYYYRWMKNNEILEEQVSDELDTTGFKKGDLVTVFVTPDDGEIRGDEKMSPSLLISNRPPEIISAPLGTLSDGVYSYQVEATDPEGDVLTYSLESAPPSMKIDSSSGLITWKIPEDVKGIVAVKVVASDGEARAFQGFNLTLGE